MAKIAVLGFALESNRFAPVTRIEDFEARCWLEGPAILADASQPAPRQAAEIPAFLKEISKHLAAEIVPILAAGAEPGGPLDDAVLDKVTNMVRSYLTTEGPVDGVYIASHGAMVGRGELDPDGALVETIRDIVGPHVPIVVTLDLHANASGRMVNACNCLLGYRTNPHVDQARIAREAAIILARMINGTSFHMAFVRLPFTPPSVTLLTNGEGAYAERMADAAGLTDPDGEIANATVLGGFVFSDTPDNGVSVLVTATERDKAQREAARLAGQLWADRHHFHRNLTPVDTAVLKVTERNSARWILSDSGDNPGGGGRGTTTELLAALVDANARGVLYGLYVDAQLSQEATDIGVGGTFNARFLRDGSDGFSEPLTAPADVIAVSDGKVVGRRGLVAGRAVDLGPTAALRIGDIVVVVVSQRKQCADPVYFEHLGLDPADFRTLVVKSRGHFRAGFDEFFRPDQVLEVDTKGLTSPVLTNFAFHGLPRPSYPLDHNAEWTPPDWAIVHLEALGLLP